MYKYLLPLYLTVLFADNKMHPEDLKNRPHYSLGYGVMGATYIDGNQVFIGQSSSSLNNGSVYIYNIAQDGNISKDEILPNDLLPGHI